MPEIGGFFSGENHVAYDKAGTYGNEMFGFKEVQGGPRRSKEEGGFTRFKLAL